MAGARGTEASIYVSLREVGALAISMADRYSVSYVFDVGPDADAVADVVRFLEATTCDDTLKPLLGGEVV